jgi:hypothetical protein
MAVVILPGSAIVGIFFFVFSWGLSFPLAIYILPLLFIIGGLFSLLFCRDTQTRKSMIIGVLAGAFLWASTCACLIMIPSRVRYLFRYTFPGLRQSDLDGDGEQIAGAAKGKYLGASWKEGKMSFEMDEWRQVNAEVRGDDLLEVTGFTVDSLGSFDSVLVTRKVRRMSEPFLNSNGRRVLADGKWTQQPSRELNKRTGLPQRIDVLLMDSNNTVIIAHVSIGNYLGLRISKDHSVLEE